MSRTSNQALDSQDCDCDDHDKTAENEEEKGEIGELPKLTSSIKKSKSGSLLKTSTRSMNSERSEHYGRLLRESQHTVSNRDMLIAMLQNQLKKMEDLYKKTLDDQQDVRSKYTSVVQQLSNMKLMYLQCEEENEMILKESRSGDEKQKEERDLFQREAAKWKAEYEALLTKLQSTPATKTSFSRNAAKDEEDSARKNVEKVPSRQSRIKDINIRTCACSQPCVSTCIRERPTRKEPIAGTYSKTESESSQEFCFEFCTCKEESGNGQEKEQEKEQLGIEMEAIKEVLSRLCNFPSKSDQEVKCAEKEIQCCEEVKQSLMQKLKRLQKRVRSKSTKNCCEDVYEQMLQGENCTEILQFTVNTDDKFAQTSQSQDKEAERSKKQKSLNKPVKSKSDKRRSKTWESEVRKQASIVLEKEKDVDELKNKLRKMSQELDEKCSIGAFMVDKRPNLGNKPSEEAYKSQEESILARETSISEPQDRFSSHSKELEVSKNGDKVQSSQDSNKICCARLGCPHGVVENKDLEETTNLQENYKTSLEETLKGSKAPSSKEESNKSINQEGPNVGGSQAGSKKSLGNNMETSKVAEGASSQKDSKKPEDHISTPQRVTESIEELLILEATKQDKEEHHFIYTHEPPLSKEEGKEPQDQKTAHQLDFTWPIDGSPLFADNAAKGQTYVSVYQVGILQHDEEIPTREESENSIASATSKESAEVSSREEKEALREEQLEGDCKYKLDKVNSKYKRAQEEILRLKESNERLKQNRPCDAISTYDMKMKDAYQTIMQESKEKGQVLYELQQQLQDTVEEHNKLLCNYGCQLKKLKTDYENAKSEIQILREDKEALNEQLAACLKEKAKSEDFICVEDKTNLEKVVIQKDKDSEELKDKPRQTLLKLENAGKEKTEMQNENEKVKSRYDEFKSDLEEAKKEIEANKAELSEELTACLRVKKDTENLKNAYEEATKENANLEELARERERNISELQNRLEVISGELEDVKQGRDKYKEMIDDCGCKYKKLEFEHQNALKEIKALRENSEALNDQLTACTHERVKINEEAENWKNACETSKQEAEKLKNELLQYQTDLNRSQNKLKIISEELGGTNTKTQKRASTSDCECECRLLQGDYQPGQKDPQQAIPQDFDQSLLNDEKIELESKNTKLTCDVGKLRADFEDAQKEVLRLTESKHALDDELRTYLNENARIKDEVKTWKDACEQALEEKANLEVLFIQTQIDVKNAQDRLNAMTEKFNNMHKDRIEAENRYQNLIVDYESKLAKINSEYEDAGKKLRHLEESNEILDEQLKFCADVCAKAKAEPAKWKTKHEASVQEKDILQNVILQKDKELADLQEKMRQVLEALQIASQEKTATESFIAECGCKMEKLNLELENAKSKIEDAEENRDILNKQLKICTEECSRLKADPEKWKEKYQQSLQEKEDLQNGTLQKDTEIEKLQNKLRQTKELLDNAGKELAEFANKNLELTCECGELKTVLERTKNESLLLREEKEAVNEQLMACKYRCSKSKDENEEIIGDNEVLRKLLLQKESDINELRDKLNSVSKELQDKTAEVEEQYRRSISANEFKFNELNTDHENVQNAILQREAEIEELRDKLMQTKEMLDDATGKKTEFENKNLELTCECSELKTVLDITKNEILELKEGRKAVNEQLMTCEDKLAKSKDESEEILREYEDLKKLLHQKVSDSNELRDKLNSISKELQESKQKVAEIEEQNKKLISACECRFEKLNADYENAQIEIRQINKSKEALNEQLMASMDESAKCRGDAQNWKDAYQKATEDKRCLENDLRRKERDVKESLNKLRDISTELEKANHEKAELGNHCKIMLRENERKLDELNAALKDAQEETLLLKEALNEQLVINLNERAMAKSEADSLLAACECSEQQKGNLENQLLEKEITMNDVKALLRKVADIEDQNKKLICAFICKIDKLTLDYQEAQKEISRLKDALNQEFVVALSDAGKSPSCVKSKCQCLSRSQQEPSKCQCQRNFQQETSSQDYETENKLPCQCKCRLRSRTQDPLQETKGDEKQNKQLKDERETLSKPRKLVQAVPLELKKIDYGSTEAENKDVEKFDPSTKEIQECKPCKMPKSPKSKKPIKKGEKR